MMEVDSMQNQALPTAVLLHIVQQLNINLKSLMATIELLDEGSTVPFIARYRKEPAISMRYRSGTSKRNSLISANLKIGARLSWRR
jgi:transcriptional accessory protein Tex/SPT6